MIERGIKPDGSDRRPATFGDWLAEHVEILVWLPVLILMWLLDLRVF